MSEQDRAREARFKEQAAHLRSFLTAAGVELKHTTSLQAVARMYGAQDWRSLLASNPQPEPFTTNSPSTGGYAVTISFQGHTSVILAPALKLGIHTFMQEARGLIDVLPTDAPLRFVGQDIDMALPVLSLMWENSTIVALSHPMLVDGNQVVDGPDGVKLAPIKPPKLHGVDEAESFFTIAVAMGEAFAMRTASEATKRMQQASNSLTAHMLGVDFGEALIELAVRTQRTQNPPALDIDPRELLHSIDKIKLLYTAVAVVTEGV